MTNNFDMEEYLLEEAKERDHKKKKNIPDKIVIWSVNDLNQVGKMVRGRPKTEHKFVEGAELKPCSKCKQYLPLTDFSKDNKRWDKLRLLCKECGNEKGKKYRESDRGKETTRKYMQSGRSREVERKYRQTIEGKYKSHRKDAKRRNYAFNLTLNQFRGIVTQTCLYCGLTSEAGKLNGIDRIDNTKGYELNNCVPCCTKCNRMKLDHTVDQFHAQICKIYMHMDKMTNRQNSTKHLNTTYDIQYMETKMKTVKTFKEQMLDKYPNIFTITSCTRCKANLRYMFRIHRIAMCWYCDKCYKKGGNVIK